MSNHSAPSVRLRPPGLVFSLLLLLLVMVWHPHLPTKHLFWAKHADALSLSGSICLCLSLSFPSPLFLPASPSSSLYCWPRPSNQMDKQIMWEKRGKKMFCYLGDAGRSNLSCSVLTPWLNAYPPRAVVCSTFPVQDSLLPLFIRLILLCLLKNVTVSLKPPFENLHLQGKLHTFDIQFVWTFCLLSVFEANQSTLHFKAFLWGINFLYRV